MSDLTEAIRVGIHYYKSKRYDEAISYFNNFIKNEKDCKKDSKEVVSEAYLWIGKFYFAKTETRVHSYRIPSRLKSLDFSFREYQVVNTQKTKLSSALVCFNSALASDPSLVEAHYWKGKTLQYMGQIEDAYRSYIDAAKLNQDKRFTAKCLSLFSEHVDLPFIEMRESRVMPIDRAFEAVSSDNAYTRIEGCLALSHFVKSHSDPEKIKQIQLKISALAGCHLICAHIPYTGDSDPRVREVASSILNRIDGTN